MTAIYYTVMTGDQVLRIGQYSTTQMDFSSALDIVISEESDETYSDFIVELSMEQMAFVTRFSFLYQKLITNLYCI